MRARFVFGLAAAMVLANAVPAMATSWEVCFKPAAVESGGDLNVSIAQEMVGTTVVPVFYSTVANVYPMGTFHLSIARQTSCTTKTAPVGTFFARAGLVASLPNSNKLTDVYYVDWHFKISGGKGQFGTSGTVKSGNPGVTFFQIVTGSFGGLTTGNTATVLVLSNAGDKFMDTVNIFRITVP